MGRPKLPIKERAKRRAEQVKLWRQENPEVYRAAGKRWRKRNPEKVKAMKRRWEKANPEKLRAMRRRVGGKPPPTRPEPKRCECCGGPSGRQAMSLDHCHKTNKFRGWLCWKCNCAIGMLGDTIKGVKRALKYLVRSDQPKRT